MLRNTREILRYKELLVNLTRKELKVKYRNSALGFVWSLLNPILVMIVFTVVFSFILRFDLGTRGNFPFHLLAALLPWNFFSQSVQLASGGIVGNAPLVRKVYFPRAVLPLSVIGANLVGFAIEMGVFIVFLTVFAILGYFPYPFYLYLVFLVVLVPALVAFTVGLSLLVSAVNVFFRDIEHLISILILVWFYASPVIYPFGMVVKSAGQRGLPWLPLVYKLNPMASLIICFRDIFYWTKMPSLTLMAYVVVSGFGMLTIGYWLFTRYEPDFAEEV